MKTTEINMNKNFIKSKCDNLFLPLHALFQAIKDFFKNIKENNVFIKDKIIDLSDNQRIEIYSVLIEIFYKNNFTGPFDQEHEICEIFGLNLEELNAVDIYCSKQLSIDGEDIRSVAKYPLFLWLSWQILNFSSTNIFELSSVLNFYILWSQMFDQPLSYFKEKCDKLTQDIFLMISNIQTIDENLKKTLLCQCLQSSLIFKNFDLAKKMITFLTDLLHMDLSMTGIMGKRTKYQIKDLAQLVLKVKVNNSSGLEEQSNKYLPEDVSLDDDTLLPHILLNSHIVVPNLDEFQQSLLILICYFKQNHCPAHELVTEQLLPYIEIVLKKPRNYLIGKFALYLRCQIEHHSTRKTERAILQMETLINEFASTVSNVESRMESWKLTIPLPFWKLKESLALILMKMGCFNSAIDHLNDIKSFNELLSCYIANGRREKAENIINQEIKRIGKTPHLLCLLGQINNEIEYYEEAWVLSKGKSFRSQLQLGYFYLESKNYTRCTECFEKALEINTIQPNIWYNLGCAYLHQNNTNKAITAFRTCCNLAPDHFKSWTNLASILEYKENFPAAHNAILTAISCHYDHWQAWIKLAEISIKLERPNDVLRAIERLSDLDPGSVDKTMVGYIVHYVSLTHDDKSESIKKQLKILLAKIASKSNMHYSIWFLCSKLYDQNNEQDILKVADFLNRSLRALIFHDRQWLTDSHETFEILDIVRALSDNFTHWSNILDANIMKSIINSSVLNFGNIISHFDKVLPDLTDEQLIKSIQDCSNNLLSLKNEIIKNYNVD